uniref:Uncharacterized protein n=1 Tax=Strongyloides stercoralis TaxID=6248 RepID=A0A0K0E588_STRER
MSKTKDDPKNNINTDSDDEFPLNELIPEDQRQHKIKPLSAKEEQDELFKMHSDKCDDIPELINEND